MERTLIGRAPEREGWRIGWRMERRKNAKLEVNLGWQLPPL
jgi:hypothetical protein